MKVLVVDDETLARERLLRLLTRVMPEAELEEAANGQQALELVASSQPDLLLLDIQMPGLDGLGVAAALQDMPQPPALIFCTAYDQYALEALDRQAVAYLLKPVREDKLRSAIDSASRVNRVQLQALGAERVARSHVVRESHQGLDMVPANEVRCFVASQKYVEAIHPGGRLLVPDTLKDLEEEFAGQFLRVHRNALVAIAHISALRRGEEEGWFVALDGVDERPAVSRRHLSLLKEKLKRS
jgi:two-component system response regulator AlgR